MATAAALPAPRHPLLNPWFRKWWMGSTVSIAGDQFYLVALPWVVLQLTGSGLAMGTVLMTAAIPRALLMLLGGAITDRTSPRKVLMATAGTRAAAVALIGLLLWTLHIRLWHLYVLGFAFGVADAFAMPAASAFLPSLVESEQLPAANSVAQSTALLAGILGPTPAGFLIKAKGVAWAFVLDAISFLFIIGALIGLPDPAARAGVRKPSILKSVAEGLGFVKQDVALRTLMAVAAVINFCTIGPFSVGLAYLAKHRFASPSAYGLCISSVAAGALAGMMLAGLARSKRRGKLLLGGSALLGMGMTAIGFLQPLWSIAVLLLAMGAISGYVNVQLQSWIQQRVEVAVRGRVMSVLMLAAFGLMPLSLATAGILVGWSVAGMFALAGLAVVAMSAIGAMQRQVREIE